MFVGKIDQFQGQYRWLSNFWPAIVIFNDIQYPSVENAYQAAKTLDLAKRKPFETCTAFEAKKMGRHLVMRPHWNDDRVAIMNYLVIDKFFTHPHLETLLVETGNAELIEGNHWHDTFWGVCNGQCRRGPHAPGGENVLGKILMDVRKKLQLS